MSLSGAGILEFSRPAVDNNMSQPFHKISFNIQLSPFQPEGKKLYGRSRHRWEDNMK
jgi:hypothetical protein